MDFMRVYYAIQLTARYERHVHITGQNITRESWELYLS